MTSQNKHVENTADQNADAGEFMHTNGDWSGDIPPDEFEAVAHPAPEAVVKKGKSRLKAVMWTFLFFLLLGTVAAVGLFANYVHEQYMQVHPLAVDSRPCELDIKVGKTDDIIKVTGARQYRYNYKEVLGHRIILVDSIREETHLSLNGTKMLVIGNSEKEGWWSLPIGQGEVFNLPLPPADHYTFVAGDKQSVGVVSYKKFCR